MAIKTTDEIFGEMREKYREATGRTINNSCDMAVRMSAAAAGINSLYTYNEWIKGQCFPQTATGEFLDYHAQVRGLERQGAVCATGRIKFSIDDALATDLTIKKGTVCRTAGNITFETTADAVITAGELSCAAPAICRVPGTSGNVAAGTIVFMTNAPIGVSSCTNTADFAGGNVAEDDESLRKRILASYSTLPNGANEAYYRSEVLNVDGVAEVTVLPKNRGIGTVDIVFSSTGGIPDTSLINQVKNILNEKREICVDISVAAPTAIETAVSAKIDIEDGYTFEVVKQKAISAITKLFDGRLLGKSLTLAKIANTLFETEGVKNYKITSPSGDISATNVQLPVVSEITIEEWQ